MNARGYARDVRAHVRSHIHVHTLVPTAVRSRRAAAQSNGPLCLPPLYFSDNVGARRDGCQEYCSWWRRRLVLVPVEHERWWPFEMVGVSPAGKWAENGASAVHVSIYIGNNLKKKQ